MSVGGSLPVVAIVGGTHGNEMTGINFVKAMQASPERFQRAGVDVRGIIANPEVRITKALGRS